MKKPETLREEMVSVLDPKNPDLFDFLPACPCCDSSDIIPYFEKYGYMHSLCRSCNFVFVNPTPKPDKLNELYEADMYKKVRENIEIPRAIRGDDYASLSIDKADALEIIQRVLRLGIVEGSWLDIGGGIGSLLHLAKVSGLQNWHLALLEFNSVSANFAREHYKINVFGSIDDVKTEGAKFDVISLIAVLEHVSNPKEILLSAKNLLSENGVLIVNLPHYPAAMMGFRKEFAYFLPPYHLSLFNKQNLCDLLVRLGFKVDTSWQSGKPAFAFQYFFPFAERIDSRIPIEVRAELEYFFFPRLTIREKIINRVCSGLNMATGPIRRWLMPRSFLNVVAKNAY